MIIKFCFENEIHRCSDPPKDFSLIYDFLVAMFTTTLPKKIELSYVNPAGQTVFINSQEDYDNLVSNASSKTVKILISEKTQFELPDEKNALNEEFEGEAAEYEVIRNDQEEKREEVAQERGQEKIIEISEDVEEKEPLQETQILLNSQNDQKDEYDEVLLNKVSERISEKYVMPQVQSNPGLQPHQVKELIREALKEELPFIIAQVKESLKKEEQQQEVPAMSKPVIAPVQDNQPANKPPASYPTYYSYPYYYQPPINRVNSYPGQPVYQALPLRPQDNSFEQPQQPQRMIFGPPAPVNNSPRYAPVNNSPRYAPPEQQNAQNAQQEKRPHLLDKVVNVLSGPINKATEMMDNFVQKFEGDPYVQCPEGKYNKSVVEKVAQLKDVFPEENRKDLLDFVQRFPRDAPLDQLAEVYWSKKKMA